MTVYVDELLPWGKSATWRYNESCHMTADTLEELHDFAQKKLGFPRRWFQPNRIMPHYDLNKNMRAKAVRCGAVEVRGTERAKQMMIERGLWQDFIKA